MSARPWDKAKAAEALEVRTVEDLDKIKLPAPHVFVKEIRIYLQRMTDIGRTKNGVHVLSHAVVENGDTQINAGPTIFREPCSSCIHFRSGATLSFGITLRFDGGRTTLLSYRFYLRLVPASGIQFVRIDLNVPKNDNDPLHVPRSHIHPGFEDIHIPFPVMTPLAILDRIVHVIEPHFTR